MRAPNLRRRSAGTVHCVKAHVRKSREIHRGRKRKGNKGMRIWTLEIGFRFLPMGSKRRDWFSTGVPGLDGNQIINHGEHGEHGEIKTEEIIPGLDFPCLNLFLRALRA